MPTTGPNLGLTIADTAGASNWDAWMNPNLALLDAVLFLNVISRALNTPPGSPANGDRYTVGSSPTGDWSGQAGKIAVRRNSAWVFITPKEGWLLTSNADAGKIYKYESGAFVLAGDGTGLGSVALDDLTDVVITSPVTGARLVYNGTSWIDAPDDVVLMIAVSDESTAITAGTAKVTFRMPFAMKLTGTRASLGTASTSGAVQVDINETGTSILSTKLTIDQDEKTSTTAATAAVISDVDLADDAEITIDIDSAGTGAKGLKVALLGTR